MSIQDHVTNIETAVLNAEAYAETIEDAELKAAARSYLANLHNYANGLLNDFKADFPAEIAALRSGGQPKD